MKKVLNVPAEEPLLLLGSGLVYAQKKYWCSAGFYPLKMSIIRPRRHFKYDPPQEKLPLIVFLCGGGWTEVDPDVWIPELTYFAKHGYVVASVTYSLAPTWFFPEPLKDIKLAIRYLRAHADRFGIDPERIAVMGESAGGHFAALAGVTGETREFDAGDWLEQSSAVKAAVPWYPCVDMMDFEGRGDIASYGAKPQNLKRGREFEPQSMLAGVQRVREHPDLAAAMDPCTYITEKTPPFLILHGSGDTIVPIHNSEKLYDTLQAHGVPSDFVVIEGADHAAYPFVQTQVKELILDFLNRNV